MYRDRMISFFALLLAICFVTIAVLFSINQTWLPEQPVRVAEANAREAEADAEKAQYEAELASLKLQIEQAKSDLQLAKGQKAILESAARSIDSDRELTEYYAHRGDTRVILFVVSVLGLAFCGIVFTYVMNRRHENERHAQTHP